MNKRCDGCGGLESNCDCSTANGQTTTNLGGPVKTDIRDQLISNSLVPLSRQEGKRFNLFGAVVTNANPEGVNQYSGSSVSSKSTFNPKSFETSQKIDRMGANNLGALKNIAKAHGLDPETAHLLHVPYGRSENLETSSKFESVKRKALATAIVKAQHDKAQGTTNAVGKVDTQLRHLETGQFMPKSGASQKQTHSAAEKGADQGQGQSMAKPGQDDSGGEVVPGQESNELDDEAGKRGMSSSELKKQLGIQDKKPTKNLASWFMSNLTDNAWSDAAREASAAARKAGKLGVTSFDSKGFASAGAKGASQLASKASEGAKGSRTGHEQAAAYHGIAAKEHDKAADLHEKGNSSKAVVEAHRNAAEAHRGAQEEHSNMLSTRKQG